MGNEFEENNNFFGLNGTINRRTFITNFLIVEVVESLIFTTPMMILMMCNPDLLGEFIKFISQTNGLPRWISIWSLITGIVEIALMYPSIVKRIRDITGKADNTILVFVTIIAYILAFNACKIPVLQSLQLLFSWIAFTIIICLMVMKGKISGEKPKSDLIKFNWGAMFGTWIWGLCNKSYYTLFAIPLTFTIGIFPFMLICGLKGNEWAYKSAKSKSIEDFHNYQSGQAALFSSIMPISFIIITIFLISTTVINLGKYLKTHPQAMKKLENYSVLITKTSVNSRYDKIEFTKEEYKFYLNPIIWKNLSKSAKLNLFQVTENYVLMDENKEMMNDITGRIKYTNKIKIYSSFNNEILAERNADEEKCKEFFDKYKNAEISFQEFIKIFNSGYKFNENPTLP